MIHHPLQYKSSGLCKFLSFPIVPCLTVFLLFQLLIVLKYAHLQNLRTIAG